MLMHV